MSFLIDRFRLIATFRTGSMLITLAATALTQLQANSQADTTPTSHSTPNAQRLTPNALCNQTGPAPQVHVDCFEAERGYTVGRDDVILLCVVHNVSSVPLPDKTLRLHCLPLAGLDYTTGDTLPPVPALAPDQSAAFRWRFTATDESVSPVAAVFVEPASGPPGVDAPSVGEVALTVVPRFDSLPRFGAPIAGVDVSPQAGSAGSEAWLSSNRAGLRFLASMRGEPLLLLAVRVGQDWQTAAYGLPLARVLTAEDGQTTWWQSLRWRQTRARTDKETATLTLVGAVGDCWHAELEFTARHDTGAIDGRLRLRARRNARLQALQLPRLLVGGPARDALHSDGVPALLPPFSSAIPFDARVAAVRTSSGNTCGLTWSTAAPLANWAWTPLPVGDPDAVQALGARCVGPAQGDLIQAGATVEFAFRLFALAPSDTVRDALRFVLP